MARFTLEFPAVAFLLAVLALVTTPISAQVPTGIPQFGTFGRGPIDTVNLATLNAHLEVPVRQTPGRKLPFAEALNQDTAVWYPAYSTQSLSWGWNYAVGTDPNSPDTSNSFPLRASVTYGIPVPWSLTPGVRCTHWPVSGPLP
jgi:hypothetical protein